MPDAYLNDVPGVKDVRIRGGSLLPRRNVIEIDGARVYDDAVNGQTVIDIAPPWVVRVIDIASFPDQVASTFQCPNTNADVYRLADIEDLLALGAPAAGDRRKVWLLNASEDIIEIHHESGSAPTANRFVTPSGESALLAGGGGLVLATYIASRWRLMI